MSTHFRVPIELDSALRNHPPAIAAPDFAWRTCLTSQSGSSDRWRIHPASDDYKQQFDFAQSSARGCLGWEKNVPIELKETRIKFGELIDEDDGTIIRRTGLGIEGELIPLRQSAQFNSMYENHQASPIV
jgi:hypothetical protein